MSSARVLVIEDEFLVGEDIVLHLRGLGYDATGPVDNYDVACMLLKTGEFDIALIDIKINGKKDGIDIATFIRSELDVPIVFLSSLDTDSILDRARALRPSAYLFKPFHARAVAISLETALTNHSLHNNTKPSVSNQEPNDVLPLSKYLFLKKENFYQRILLDDILWIKADGNYTEFNTTTHSHVQTIQLSKVESRLTTNKFLRVHRSYMVNLEAITGYLGNTLYIRQAKIPVSSAYRDGVFSLLNSV